jgi:hypothetical protein
MSEYDPISAMVMQDHRDAVVEEARGVKRSYYSLESARDDWVKARVRLVNAVDALEDYEAKRDAAQWEDNGGTIPASEDPSDRTETSESSDSTQSSPDFRQGPYKNT